MLIKGFITIFEEIIIPLQIGHEIEGKCNYMPKYSSTIKTRGFLFHEAKKASTLYLQGFTFAEIMQKAVEENIFLLNTENRRKEIAATVMERIGTLDDFLHNKLVYGILETGKLIVLYTINKTDRLFFEFMQEVYREKHLLRDYVIADRDFSAFFYRKAEQSNQLMSWADYTFYKLGQVYKRILLESGLAKRSKRKLEIVRAVIEQDVKRHIIESGDRIYIEVIQGEV